MVPMGSAPDLNPQVKYKEVKARNSQLLKMLQQGESEYSYCTPNSV
jgi:hypothetical protein